MGDDDEREVACEAEAAQVGCKKGKNCVVEESGADAGAKGSKPQKRVKIREVGSDDESPLEATEVSCNR